MKKKSVALKVNVNESPELLEMSRLTGAVVQFSQKNSKQFPEFHRIALVLRDRMLVEIAKKVRPKQTEVSHGRKKVQR